jgi:hypothetical protein
MLKLFFPLILLVLPFQVATSRQMRFARPQKSDRPEKLPLQPNRVEFVAETLPEEVLPVALVSFIETTEESESWDNLPANEIQPLL